MLPEKALQHLTALAGVLDRETTSLPCVHRVRWTGDEYVAISNLLESEGEHIRWICMLALRSRVTLSALAMPLQCGVHVGPVSGVVIGAKLPRYDVFGEGFDIASCLAASCTVDEIMFSRAVLDELAVSNPAVLQFATASDQKVQCGDKTVDVVTIRTEVMTSLYMCIEKGPQQNTQEPSALAVPVHDQDASTQRRSTVSSLHTAAADDLANQMRDLSIESQCWRFVFSDAAQEAFYTPHPSLMALRVVWISLFFLVVGMGASQAVTGLQLATWSGIAGHSLLIGALVVIVVSIAVVIVSHKHLRGMLSVLLLFIVIQLVVFGAALVSPSLISNDLSVWMICFTLATTVLLDHLRWLFSAFFIVLFVFFPSLVATQIGNSGSLRLSPILCTFLIFATSVWSLRSHEYTLRRRFAQKKIEKSAGIAEEVAEGLYRDALAATVPQPILKRITRNMTARAFLPATQR